MEEFLNKLYSYEYFGTYLMIAIAVLVLLFIIVLCFGKKDQKKREIEETKKLQQINNQDAFKEDDNIASVEVPKEEIPTPTMTQEKLENDTIVVPNISNLNSENNVDSIPEPDLPKEVPSVENVENEVPINDDNLNIENQTSTITPILEKTEEKPLVFNDQIPEDNVDFTMPDENPEQTIPLVDVPDFNFDEIVSGVEEIKEEEKIVNPIEMSNDASVEKPNEIFSSVFVPEKKNEEISNVENVKNSEEDLDIELPTLKKDVEKEKIEIPEINDYNLDNITGEDYNINR